MPGLTVRTSKSGGVHLPSLTSNESNWLAPPFRKRKMQHSAPPLGVTLSFATTLTGRSMGSSQYPETVMAPLWKRCRRLRVGTPGISRISIVVKELRFIDKTPRQVLECLVVPLLKRSDRYVHFGSARWPRQKSQEHLVDDFLIAQRRVTVQKLVNPSAFVSLDSIVDELAVEQLGGLDGRSGEIAVSLIPVGLPEARQEKPQCL